MNSRDKNSVETLQHEKNPVRDDILNTILQAKFTQNKYYLEHLLHLGTRN